MNSKTTLVLTEGIFDIIGVYLSLYNGVSSDNTIFSAVCGKAYKSVILNYIRKGFLDLDIIIYSDADVDPSFYRDMKSNSLYLKNSRITIFYNSLYDSKTGYGKDFGVPKDQIQLRKIII